MTWQAWFSLGVVVALLAILTITSLAPDAVLIGGLAVLLLSGIVTPNEALAGFANEGMITVGVLYVVGAGVVETGGVTWLAERLFGRPKSVINAITRMLVPTAVISAFMNNTPQVAMMIPAVSDWAKRYRIPVSKLMLPLSYGAILGGTCTLIGTSTNLVVDGLLIKAHDSQYQATAHTNLPRGLNMFDITWVGVPCAIAGCAFIIATQRWLLPDRKPALSMLSDPREYTVEMLVTDDSPLVGKSIEQAGLRHLPGVFLAEIDREGFVLPAVSPEERLRANDRLVFVGVVDSVVDMQKIRGLIPATDQVFKLTAPRSERCLVEAVVSNACPVVNKTIRDGRFRSVYNAVVIAVARHGERIQMKIGDIVLRVGDTLLLEAPPSFFDQQRNSRDFLLISRLENSNPPRHERSFVSLAILLGMVVLVTFSESAGQVAESLGLGSVTMLKAAVVAAGLMLATRCVTAVQARRSIDWATLLAIAASFGLGEALEKTGAASAVGSRMIDLAGGSPWLTLAIVYGVTLVITELITNNAAAALMFPFSLVTAETLHVSPMPFIIVVMVAASSGFATPMGYQTNLMVYGPGGYRSIDYVRLGVPLDILIWIITVAITPLVWPFK